MSRGMRELIEEERKGGRSGKGVKRKEKLKSHKRSPRTDWSLLLKTRIFIGLPKLATHAFFNVSSSRFFCRESEG